MRTLRFLLQKEFRQIFRNPIILRMIIVIPIVQLLILPLAADFEIKNIRIAIVDQDRSSYAQRLSGNISASGYFQVALHTHSYSEAFDCLERDQADVVLEIPKNFERNLVRENSAKVYMALNAINGTKASVGGAYLGRIVSSFNNDIRLEWMEPFRYSPIATIEITSINRFNPLLRYPLFMVPGILVLLVTMVGIYMSTLNVVKEKEVGTIEQINVTPIKKYHFILGKMIPFWVIGMFVFSIGLFLIGRLVYGIVPVGNLALLYVFLGLFLIAILGIGLLLSTYAATQQQAMSLAFFFMMIFILMSGLFTPIESMPEWAKWITRFNPVTYFIEVMRMVVMKGSGFRDIQRHFLIMSLFALLFNSWAIWNYRKTS